MQKISKGADPGDHFRTTEIKLGHEGRGWAQRSALCKNSPSLVSFFLLTLVIRGKFKYKLIYFKNF